MRQFRRALVLRSVNPEQFGIMIDANLVYIQRHFDARNITVDTKETVVAPGVSSFFAIITYDGFLESNMPQESQPVEV